MADTNTGGNSGIPVSAGAIYLNLLKPVSKLISTSNMFHTFLKKLLLRNLYAKIIQDWQMAMILNT